MGHPFSQLKQRNNEEVISKHSLDSSKDFISILPGSRVSEISHLMPVYVAAAKKLLNLNSNTFFLIPAANKQLAEMIQSTKGINEIPYKLSIDSAQDFLSLSSISIVTSGTASLEAAVLGSVRIICYKTHKLNYRARERAQFLSLVPKNYIPDGFSLGSISLVEEGIMLTNSIIPENNFDLFIENNKGINFGKPLKKGNDIFFKSGGNLKKYLGNLYRPSANNWGYCDISITYDFDFEVANRVRTFDSKVKVKKFEVDDIKDMVGGLWEVDPTIDKDELDLEVVTRVSKKLGLSIKNDSLTGDEMDKLFERGHRRLTEEQWYLYGNNDGFEIRY